MNNKTVVQYLVSELQKLGVEDFFGLPGDYNFNILDAIIENPKTSWVGCTNELNAGYAADGYARIKGYGALVTTYGVGELSAVNAIAGSFAENIPVIKISGVPAEKFINNNTVLHHNFQNPDYRAFERVYSNISAGTAYLSFENAKEEIDRILSLFKKEQKPVYIAIPMDVCNMKIESSSNIQEPQSDLHALNDAAEHAARIFNSAENPVILADVLIRRFKAEEDFLKFANATGCPFATLLMGKSLVDSEYKNYMGTYQGEYGNIDAYEMYAKSDGVVCIGTVASDLNTFRFNLPFSPDEFINIQGNYTVVQNVRYDNVLMKDILNELSFKVKTLKDTYFVNSDFYEPVTVSEDSPLTNKFLYPKIQEFLKPNDIIFAETGILSYAMAQLKLPKGAVLNNQILWGSIGWATPASFGAQIAEKNRRTILITGEGSHQLTATEVSNFMRHGLKPIIFVINNSGYTIERILSKDPMDEFNDIANWNYSKLTDVFEGEAWNIQVRTEAELEKALKMIETQNASKLCYVELFIDKMDIPELTERVIKGIKLYNSSALSAQ